MKRYKLELRRLSVREFDIRDKTIRLKLDFDCVSGKESKSDSVEWKTTLEYPELEAHKIMTEARKKVKHSGEMVTIEYDEDPKDFVMVLTKVQELSKQVFIKKTSDGYMQLIDRLKSFQHEFRRPSPEAL